MEGDAGTSQLNPTGADEARSADEFDADIDASDTVETEADPEPARRQERFGRGSLIAIVIALLVVAGGIGYGGYLALRGGQHGADIAREDTLAMERAKECVAATQAPDVAAMTASQSKIIECATGDFAVQANLYSGMLVEVYQIANVSVQVSDMRAAVEKHNSDDTVDVLVAVRVKVTNAQAPDQEQGYRLRVKMAPADGTYKVARLDQVTS